MKKTLKKIIRPLYKTSYAQGGEDMILNSIFTGVKKGTYIDIGANSPFDQSNTAFFYKKGWTGYNIDANPHAIKRLNSQRKKDCNILALLSDDNAEVNYNYFEISLYNGVNNPEEIPSKLLKTERIKGKTLKQLIEEYNIPSTIDFLSIDVEGYDYKVLQSIDFNLLRPRAIVIESFDYLVDKSLNNKFSQLLQEKDYLFIAKTITNSIYVTKEFYSERFQNK